MFDLIMFFVQMVATHNYVPVMDVWGFGEDSSIVDVAMSVSESVFGLYSPVR